MWGNAITDVQPLARLTNLQWLQLGDNAIADISPLASLTNLQWLGVMENALSQHAANQQLAAITSGLRVVAVIEKYRRVETVQVYPEEPEPTYAPLALYFTDDDRTVGIDEATRRSRIWRSNLDDSDARYFFLPVEYALGPLGVPETQGSHPTGIALDMANRKMYWTNWNAHKIEYANFDGTQRQEFLASAMDGDPGDYASGLALDVVNRKIYWVTYPRPSGPGKIMWANLDGDGLDAQDCITMGLNTPWGLAVDVEGRKIYWVDRVALKVGRANLDCSGSEDIITEGLQYPLHIALGVW